MDKILKISLALLCLAPLSYAEGRTCQDDGYPAGYYWSDDAQQCLSPHTDQWDTNSNQDQWTTYVGGEGKIKVGSYQTDLIWEMSQWAVDQPNTSAVFELQGKTVIGDHRHQGFHVIESAKIGSSANFNGRVLTLQSRYSGYNTGEGLYTNNWTGIDSIEDGDVVMYVCKKGSKGYNITITFWK